jgi:neutral ceramidase
MLGFNKQNFNCIVDGVFKSIGRAHRNRTKGRILINRGDVTDCGRIRSMAAYLSNPAGQVGQYSPPEDEEMTLLKFVNENDQAIGSLNWYAVHPTSMGEKNRLISGDNKGYQLSQTRAAEIFLQT